MNYQELQEAKQTFSKEQPADSKQKKNEASARAGAVSMDLDTF